jgi:23S rRNA pseudouridine1911/1915/1917 synthase
MNMAKISKAKAPGKTMPLAPGPIAAENTWSSVVAPHEAALRLDAFLTGRALLPSRAQIQRAIAAGLALVNGSKATAGTRLREGDAVFFVFPTVTPASLAPEPMDLAIVYEDADLLVIDKPAGLVVHPAPGHLTGTLVHAVLAHCPDLAGIGGVERPGIVHRLDKDTSGLIVIAKNDLAHQRLVAQFQSRTVEKIYLTLVHGTLKEKEGMVELPVGRDRQDRKKMSTRTLRGKPARTRWRVLADNACCSLLEVRLETGRTHQIRVHFSALGHPVVGDPLYGKAKSLKRGAAPASCPQTARQALHARLLGFIHPTRGDKMIFTAPLPPDFLLIAAAWDILIPEENLGALP